MRKVPLSLFRDGYRFDCRILNWNRLVWNVRESFQAVNVQRSRQLPFRGQFSAADDFHPQSTRSRLRKKLPNGLTTVDGRTLL